MTERLLVLAVDIDNDLYRKTKINGPVIGKNDIIRAATKLAIADPQETDANTMFEAVKKFDELKSKKYSVRVATITGAEDESFQADNELSRQIDLLIDRFRPDACVLVTDGASDQRVLPLLKSRLKVNSVDLVRMKQAEQFENTYFTIIEKLKEPHYARAVFGIPAVLLLLFAISYYLNLGWQFPVALIGLYLLIKGFGLEDYIISSAKGFGFSVSRVTFTLYMSSLLFFVMSIVLAYGGYSHALSITSNPLVQGSYTIESLLLLLPVSLLLYLVGRLIDLESRHYKYKAINQGTYMGYAMVSITLIYLVSAWFIGQIYFYQLLLFSIIAIMAGYAVSFVSSALKRRAVRRSKLKDKSVVNDIGAYIGKVTGIDSKKGFMMVKTDYGSTLRFDIDRITNVSDKVIIR
ncbi:MAG: DUF373 family protein [Candidatus Marsarchaeota archaeon]|nr:DUF373 family protein [Candidatus Marsarchaeota archaeon]MCL5101918.1 DUF373 family protein [Candidatus Marsarchaeota archaeon]